MSPSLSGVVSVSTAMTSSSSQCVVVVPTLNEEKYVASCIESLLRQSVYGFSIVVADGGSTDATRTIVSDIAAREPRVSLVDNPGRLQSRAINLVASQIGEGVTRLIRADAHTIYPPDFVQALVDADIETGASTVVVPMKATGEGCFQAAAATCQNSRLGNGGSVHRRGQSSRYVDHGHHALFKLEDFRRVGGYDEDFSHNEDFELDHRIRESGGSVWLNADASVNYIPRATPWALAVQYFRHGRGRARTITKHGLTPKLRQIIPVVVLGCYLVGITLSPVMPAVIVFPLAHLAVCLLWGLVLGLRDRSLCAAASGIAAVIMHLSWASGLCVGLAIYRKTYRRGRPQEAERASAPPRATLIGDAPKAEKPTAGARITRDGDLATAAGVVREPGGR